MASYNQQKLDLKPGEALIHVDNSESYRNSQQDEVQSAYFGQQNFSIFTCCSNYRDSGEDSLTKVPMAVISESNDHSKIAAFSCIVTIELRKLMGELSQMILWRRWLLLTIFFQVCICTAYSFQLKYCITMEL